MYSTADQVAASALAGKPVPVLLPLEVHGLVFEAMGNRLIDIPHLVLPEGGITTIMGPNGAGKSLFVRLLHGLIEPTFGEIRWSDQGMGKHVRVRQAMVFQRPVLLRRSVAANIDFVLSLNGGRDNAQRDEILSWAGLLEHSRKPARRLSGGEQQRLALARALATHPEVLFLDEPTASLDPASVGEIERIVRQASRRGVKVIMVTHDAGQASRLSSDIVFVHQGSVLEHTNAQQFFTEPRCNIARDYLHGRILL